MFAGVIYCLGWSVLPLAVGMLLPAGLEAVNGNLEGAVSLVGSSIFAAFLSGATILASRRDDQEFDHHSAYLYLVLIWPTLGLVGALPFLFGNFYGSSLDCYFEAISALTTTGLSIAPTGFNISDGLIFWRSLIQWFGGFITIVFVVVIAFELGFGGIRFFKNALPKGDSVFMPRRLFLVATHLGWVYASFTLLCSLGLWLSGVTPFAGLGLSMAAISTGGFLIIPLDELANISFAGYFILFLFMTLGAINFTLLWPVTQGRLKPIFHDTELRYFVITLAMVSICLTFWFAFATNTNLSESITNGLMAGASILSTSGLMINENNNFSQLPPVAVIGLLLVGGCAGSTSGGIKIFRIAILFKQAQRELARLCHPHGVVAIKLDERDVENNLIQGVWSYFFCFLLALACIVLLLGFFGLSTAESIGTAVSAITNAGPMVKVLAPSAHEVFLSSFGAKLVIIIAMIFGRLEVIAFVALFSSAFWKR